MLREWQRKWQLAKRVASARRLDANAAGFTLITILQVRHSSTGLSWRPRPRSLVAGR